jgi:formate dehydrogenase gamma subunit
MKYKIEKVKRFSKFRILEHFTHIIIFLIMFVTGFSQKYSNLDISIWFISKVGGIENLYIIHHTFGVIFIILFVIHIFISVIGVTLYKWQPTMLISYDDFSNLVDDLRYFLGIKNIPAKCGRYNYKQKFQYWSVFICTLIMIIPGLVMLYPFFFTHFLPGQIIPLAKLVHSNQFIIFYIIALWHLYDNVFSPEALPLDTSIFTGYISKERMLKEHPLEENAVK